MFIAMDEQWVAKNSFPSGSINSGSIEIFINLRILSRWKQLADSRAHKAPSIKPQVDTQILRLGVE